MERITVEQAAEYLRAHDGYTVYNHARPDGDALGSAAALALILRGIGKKAFAFSPDGIPEKFGFLPKEGVFIASPAEAKGFIPLSVDVAGPQLLGDIEVPLFAISFDHHLVNTLECERLCADSGKIAAGEIIFALAEELGAEITKDIADSLYTAICSDSGGFRYSLTSAETHRIAAVLHEAGADFVTINRRLFESKSKAQFELCKLAYNKLRTLRGGKCAYVAITKEEMDECGAVDDDFDCVNAVPREIEGVGVSAVLRPRGCGCKVSLRSSADVDVSAIAKRFGGGGHFHAAGFSLDSGVEDSETVIRKIFEEAEL
ncbi:MAG: DHH family phosphoesterase [Clostridia bacterium]|nr:DHH family phosphoesterase [Clostridia bacterium]